MLKKDEAISDLHLHLTPQPALRKKPEQRSVSVTGRIQVGAPEMSELGKGSAKGSAHYSSFLFFFGSSTEHVDIAI